MSNIVIGSGVAGMSIALLLAKAGKEVKIIEALPFPAPLLNGFKRNGIFYDTGFHTIGGIFPGEVLHKWLNSLGIWKHIGDENIHLVEEEFYINDKKFSFPSQSHTLEESIQAQFLENKNFRAENFHAFLSQMQEEFDKSPYVNPKIKELPKQLFEEEESIRQAIEKFELPAHLQQMIEARCLLIGIEPKKTSFKHYSVLSEPYFRSCASLKGGGKALRNAFLKELKIHNIEIICNNPVTSLEIENKKIIGVQLLNGEKIACENCFYTGHPKKLESLAPAQTFRPAFVNRIAQMQETPMPFILFGKIKSDYLQDKVIYLLDKNDKDHSATIDSEKELEPIIYLSSGEAVDGYYPLCAIAKIKKNLTRDKSSYQDDKELYAQKIVKSIEKRLPQLGKIEIVECSTEQTFKDWIYASTGSIYGIAQEIDSMPLLPVTRIEGLFMAGQNILLPGILGAIVSAAVTTGFLLGHDSILEDFRKCK